MMRKNYAKKIAAVAAAAVLLLQVQPAVAAEDPVAAVDENVDVALQAEEAVPETEEPAPVETEAVETAVAEEPAEEEPVVEEPAAEEPAQEEPAAEESAQETPAAEEPAQEEPTTEEPAQEETPAEEPAREETPAAEEPAQDQAQTDIDIIPEEPAQAEATATLSPAADAEQPADVTAEETTPTPTPEEQYKTDFVYEDAEVKITAKATEAAKFSQNTEMKAEKIQEGTAEYEAAKAASAAKLGTDDKAQYTFYNVYFVADGQKLDPEKGTVSIQMEFKTVQIDPATQTQSVVHIEDTEEGTRTSDVTAPSEAGANLSSVGFDL